MSSTRSYSLVEPHPRTSAPYIHGARGGAGNIFKTSSSPWSKPSSTTTSTTSSSSSPPPRTLSSSPKHQQPSTFKSGRGGAGNTHHSSERAMFSFDEELEREMRQQAAMAPVFHVGRGGAGNMIYADSASTMVRGRDPETASRGSSSSAESAADGAAKAVRRSLEKGWAKVVGAGSS